MYQCISARLGLVTGKDLAALLGERYALSQPVSHNSAYGEVPDGTLPRHLATAQRPDVLQVPDCCSLPAVDIGRGRHRGS
jgi:hypothetical protein